MASRSACGNLCTSDSYALPVKAGEVLAEDLRLAVEGVAAVLPEARVHMAGAADPAVVGLGHESHRAALLVGHLLDSVLVDDVVVGHRQRVGEVEVDLLLARPGL